MTGENNHGRGENDTSPRILAAHDKQIQALKLRSAGKTFQEIAQQVGYSSPSGAYKAVLTALRKTLQEPADELRHLECERLDALLNAIWDKAMAGGNAEIDRALRIMERRAELLGLDAPAKVDIEFRIRQMAEQMGIDPDEAVREAALILKDSQRASVS